MEPNISKHLAESKLVRQHYENLRKGIRSVSPNLNQPTCKDKALFSDEGDPQSIHTDESERYEEELFLIDIFGVPSEDEKKATADVKADKDSLKAPYVKEVH